MAEGEGEPSGGAPQLHTSPALGQRQGTHFLFQRGSRFSSWAQGCKEPAQSQGPLVKLLFRNLPNIALYIHTSSPRVFSRRVTRPQGWPAGRTQAQVPGAVTPLLQKKCRDQRNSSHTVQHRRKVLGPPAETTRYVHGQGQASGSEPRTAEVTSTDGCRLTTDAVPLVGFLGKDKGCTILSFATTKKTI